MKEQEYTFEITTRLKLGSRPEVVNKHKLSPPAILGQEEHFDTFIEDNNNKIPLTKHIKEFGFLSTDVFLEKRKADKVYDTSNDPLLLISAENFLLSVALHDAMYLLKAGETDRETEWYTIKVDGKKVLIEVTFRWDDSDVNKLKRPQADISPFENREIASSPTGIPVRTSTLALIRPDQWENDEKKLPRFVKEYKRSGIIEHFIEAPEELSEEQKAQWLTENAWSVQKNFDTETAYMNLIYSAYAMNLSRPWEGDIKIKGSDILKILGWNKRTDLKKSELLKKVYEKARNACRFGTGGYWTIGKEKFRIERGPHWVFMGEMWDGQLTFEGTPDRPTELYITIRPGLWTKYFLNKYGQQDRSALFQFGFIAQKTLQIDPYHESVAAKLALYLTTMVKDREKDFMVKHLFEQILEQSELEQAMVKKRKTQALKNQWDNALLRLKEIGWGIRFDSTYPEELRPEWTVEGTNTTRMPKYYINNLLAAKVWFNPPAVIQGLIAAPKPNKQPGKPAFLKGIDIRTAREANKLSARDLANRMGKSQTWVTMIEKGSRAITKENEQQLREILNIPCR